jgi:hypothetical protein
MIALYITDFFLSDKSDDFSVFYFLITEMLPKIFHHPLFYLENYIYDVKKIRKCVTTHKYSAWILTVVQLQVNVTPNVTTIGQ